MGMFDEITVHCLGDTVWQTKEMQFQPLLDRFHVDHNGTLSIADTHARALDTSTFSGTVVFYGDPNHKWTEYRGTFENGRLVELRRFKEWNGAYGAGRGVAVQLPWMLEDK